MRGSTTAASRSAPPGAHVAAAAGLVAPVLFVAVFTIEGWLRPGYRPLSMFVSELSLGPRGWVQITSFVVTGALLVVFGRGLAARLGGGPGGTAGPLLVQLIGVSLIASGPFTTDPSSMFDQHSAHGVVHGIFGAVVFSLAPVSCFVLHRRFRRDPAWRTLAGPSVVVGAVLVLGIGLLKAAQQPDSALFVDKGLVQRVILISYMGWLFTVASRLRALLRP